MPSSYYGPKNPLKIPSQPSSFTLLSFCGLSAKHSGFTSVPWVDRTFVCLEVFVLSSSWELWPQCLNNCLLFSTILAQSHSPHEAIWLKGESHSQSHYPISFLKSLCHFNKVLYPFPSVYQLRVYNIEAVKRPSLVTTWYIVINAVWNSSKQELGINSFDWHWWTKRPNPPC